MNAESVSIGTELLLGFTVDTNASWIGHRLAAIGIKLSRGTIVSDAPGDIRDAVEKALSRTGLVITTGGLGPTRDDISREVIAAAWGLPLEFDPTIWRDLETRFAKTGRILSEANRPQAMVPKGAVVLRNSRGTAPGLWLDLPEGVVIMLPGVPREMRGLMNEQVIPRLEPRGAGKAIISRTISTTAIPESNLAAQIGPIEAEIAPVTLAYLPSVVGVDLRLTAWDLPPDEARSRLSAAVARVRKAAEPWAYSDGEDSVDLAADLLDQCRRRGLKLAVAESCTGGLLGARLTAIPGSSEVFVGGTIAYANSAKVNLLGVDQTVLDRDGAVSESVALAMASGVARNFQADLSVGITGIAGPDGGSTEKPVGTVWFGFQTPGRSWAERQVLPGNRDQVRQRAAQLALFRLLRSLS